MTMARENKPTSSRSYLTRPQIQAITLLFSIFICYPAHAEVYKWTDKDGGLHYSETPPANSKYEIVSPRYSAPLIPPTAAPKKDQPNDTKVSDQDKQQQAEITNVRFQNCLTVQKNLEGYESAGRIRITSPDGIVQRLTEEERQAKIAEMQALIKKYCD